MTIRAIVLISVAGLLFALESCNDNVVGPLIQPDPRDYVWSIDTLKTEFNVISGLWGSSPNDVWAGGGGGTLYNYLWHFDGKKWVTWFEYHPGGAWCSAEALFGLASNDVWMGGQSFGDPGAGLSHWDGTQWGQYFNYNPEPDNHGLVHVNNIWGPQSNNIYACGNIVFRDETSRGFVLRYDGLSWKEVLKGELSWQNLFVEFVGLGDSVYIEELRHNRENPDSSMAALYVLRGDQLTKIYSNTRDRVGIMVPRSIGGELYISMARPPNSKTYLYSDGRLLEQFHIDSPNFEYTLGGRNEKDIFLSMADGVAHFNGSDYQYLYTWPLHALSIQRIAIFDKEVFFSIVDRKSGTYNLVLHGKPKQQ